MGFYGLNGLNVSTQNRECGLNFGVSMDFRFQLSGLGFSEFLLLLCRAGFGQVISLRGIVFNQLDGVFEKFAQNFFNRVASGAEDTVFVKACLGRESQVYTVGLKLNQPCMA